MRPEEIILADAGSTLKLRFADGERHLSAATLWQNCRDATSLRQTIDFGERMPPADLNITGLQPVGAYAIALQFSDGRARGIFPWAYLRALDAGPAYSIDQEPSE